MPSNGRIRIGQAFRADAEVEMLGVVQNSTGEEKEIDIDIIAELDPTTGQPRVEERSRALRWIEALDEGPNPAFKAISPQEVRDE